MSRPTKAEPTLNGRKLSLELIYFSLIRLCAIYSAFPNLIWKSYKEKMWICHELTPEHLIQRLAIYNSHLIINVNLWMQKGNGKS